MITIYERATSLIVTGNPDEITKLVDSFRFRPNGYFFAVTFQRWKVTEGEEGWDGYIYPLRRINSATASALRGYKADIIKYSTIYGFELDLSHLLEYPFRNLTVEDVPADIIAGDHTLDERQRQCICSWLKAGIGFNKITVGGGKTATFAGAAAMIKQRYPQARFLYLTPAERLVKQATKEMRKFLPHFDIGQYGGGYKQSEAQDMVICTVAMLNRNFNALQKRGWLDTFIAVLYDEVHHCGSKSNQKILAAVPAYFRLGASDTSKEKDPSRASSIRGLFGPLLNEVTSTPLLDIGRLARPNIYVVDIPSWAGRFANVSYRPALDSDAFMLLDGEWVKGVYKGPVYELDANGEVKMRQVKTAEKDDEGNWITAEEPVTVTGLHKLLIEGAELEVESRWCLLNRMYDRAIIQFKARNELIVKWAKYFSSQGWPTVIVATRTTHVYILEALVSEAVGRDNVRILIGNDSPAVRDETFQWLKQTPGSVLVSPLVKEGVSINEIRGMIVADQVADYEVARQIIGRAMRPKKSDNVCHVVWFWDKQHPVLRKGCTEVLSRLERTEGFKFVHPCSDPASAFGSG